MIQDINPTDPKSGDPMKSVEGWIIIVTGLHDQSQQDDIYDAFSKFGQIKTIHLNVDRKTGYAKGYALLQYQKYEEAESAIKSMNNEQIYQKKIKVDWAFQQKPLRQKKKNKEK